MCDVYVIESGATGLAGLLLASTSVVLVSKGHSVGATGLSVLVELPARQCSEATPRQV